MGLIERKDLIESDYAIWESIIVPYVDGKQKVIDYLKQKEFNPKSICEIGVRSATGALLFLKNWPLAAYFGFDYYDENDAHGGIGLKALDWAGQVLEPFDFEIRILDTQKVNKLPLSRKVDFIHVDGSHTSEGVYHDLNLVFECVRPGGFILIDDYDFLEDVRKGVSAWLLAYAELKWKYFKTFRGDILIQR